MCLQNLKIRREGLLVATLLMVLTSIPVEAIENQTDIPSSWAQQAFFPNMSRDSERQCGRSSLRNEAANKGAGILGGAGLWAGAVQGAKYGATYGLKCDLITVFGAGICTLGGAALGAGIGGFLGLVSFRQIADTVHGSVNCAGGIIKDNRTGEVIRHWNYGSIKELKRSFDKESKNYRLLAVFDTLEKRCGAVVGSKNGRRFAGIGNTATASENQAFYMCRNMEGEKCEVLLSGVCNAWDGG